MWRVAVVFDYVCGACVVGSRGRENVYRCADRNAKRV